MTIMAPDFGADPIYVAVIQFCRLLFVNSAFPGLIQFIERRKLYPAHRSAPLSEPVGGRNDISLPPAPLALTAPLAICGGLLFKHFSVPSGAILGSAVFVAAENVRYGRIAMPRNAKYVVQLGIGCYVGVQMVRDSLYIISSVIVPVMILIVLSLIYSYLCSLLIYRCSSFDFKTCMLMCSPGGLNEMSIIADDMGADAPKVAVMHSIRILSIVAFSYNLIGILEYFLS